ncbi:hypothetical protein Taro_022803 [Colocasia esculenta]|uniref:MLO-like protein n=1 Tax=Colocasia esculenta TaxID=4460 RepID=A0A843VCI6_COLES|nr:hypothetical protein [Colocasia esculenta]
MGEGRSLAETPTWSVATVTTVMVATCYVVERSIYRFGKWLKETKRKALYASLKKIREELMLLGLISLLLSQTARRISQICVPSSLFSSRFYICSVDDFSLDEVLGYDEQPERPNRTAMGITRRLLETSSHQCGEDREPFVSYEGLEQLHRFLFILGMTHVLYSCVTVVLAMIKIYSWRKWENQAYSLACENLQAKKNKTMKRQSTFVFHHTSHPWSKSKILIWMLCFIRQFKVSITKSDYMALRLGFIATHKLPLSYDFHKYMVRSMEDEFHESVGISWPLWGYAVLCVFINIHGLNIYFWLSFIPAVLVMLVGTKLQHVVAQLALEVAEPAGPLAGAQLKPRDDLFWFGKPEFLLWLIQFISFQNAFEVATFIWSLLNAHSCFMKNHIMIFIRLISGILVQFWCSYSTLPLNVIITQMGSKFKKSLLAESVRISLHRWCRRVKERSRRDLRHLDLGTTRSTCSLESIMDERDETTTVASGTLSRSSSVTSLDQTLFSVSLEDSATTTSTEERLLFTSPGEGTH